MQVDKTTQLKIYDLDMSSGQMNKKFTFADFLGGEDKTIYVVLKHVKPSTNHANLFQNKNTQMEAGTNLYFSNVEMDSKSTSGLSVGTQVGLIVGCFVLVSVIVGILVYFFWYKKKVKKEKLKKKKKARKFKRRYTPVEIKLFENQEKIKEIPNHLDPQPKIFDYQNIANHLKDETINSKISVQKVISPNFVKVRRNLKNKAN